MGSSGERIREASHALFRVGSASALDQSLIERSCDWLLLWTERTTRDRRRSRSILAYVECKALEICQTPLSLALVASLGYLEDISLMHYMTGHVTVQSPCWLKPMSVSVVYPVPN